jgi:uncharacterized protein
MVKRLGSSKKPVVLRTQTMERASELLAVCEARGLKAIVGIEVDQEEDITDLSRALAAGAGAAGARGACMAPARNAPCPCGSGRKHKNCCATG